MMSNFLVLRFSDVFERQWRWRRARRVKSSSSFSSSSTTSVAWMFILGVLLQLWSSSPSTGLVSAQGFWEVVVDNAGISAMHAAVTHYGTVVLLDRTNIGPSQIALPGGRCRDNPLDQVLTHDCTAHSVEFTPGINRIRPLYIFTDTWCSSGAFGPDGTLVQTGGDTDGLFKIRSFAPCAPAAANCDWVEEDTPLQEPRWYATNQLLPNGQQIVIGGRAAPFIEFVPADGSGSRTLDLLVSTTDYQQDNLYPYVHLLPDGTLFIFANQDSIIYDYGSGATVKTLPTLPGTPRNYPSAGSSVMLPLDAANGYSTAEVVVCGGAQAGAYSNPGSNPPCAQDCGRITATDADPAWAIEYMPTPRCMGEMINLPSLTSLIINGAQKGSQGWGEATDATLNPVNYNPFAPAGARFDTWTATGIPRVYHSTANLLPDGRVLIAGSNTHQYYTFTGDFPTELRVEAFSPPYLEGGNDYLRPVITDAPGQLGYGDDFTVTVTIPTAPAGIVNLVLNSAPFSTHSYSMGQRQLNLGVAGPPVNTGGTTYTISGTAPPQANLAPSTYYMLFALNAGIPSGAVWVHIG